VSQENFGSRCGFRDVLSIFPPVFGIGESMTQITVGILVTIAYAWSATVGAPVARADDATTTTAITDDADNGYDFAKGTRYWVLVGAYTQERTGDDQYLASVAVGRGFFFLDNAAIEAQVPVYVAHDDETAGGIGFQALARYHLINIERFSFYADILGGMLWTSDDFPTGGTNFNFTYAGGPGASWRMNHNTFLICGYRFQHVSNGYIEGRDRNPIMNSIGGYVGLTWHF
jgi:hypothetical protein